jgi:hypothetical protein
VQKANSNNNNKPVCWHNPVEYLRGGIVNGKNLHSDYLTISNLWQWASDLCKISLNNLKYIPIIFWHYFAFLPLADNSTELYASSHILIKI